MKKQNKRNQIMEGGEIINKGAYGCIYNPSLQCSADKKKHSIRTKKINKIQIYNEYAINEKNIGAIIHSIPNHNERFLPLIMNKKNECSKLKVKQFKNGTLQDCTILKNSKPKTEIMLLEGEYLENSIPLGDYMMSIEKPSELYYRYTHAFFYLTESIMILLKHNIVHFDLRNPNILYDSLQNVPIILDFGISFQTKDLLQDYERIFIGYDPSYYIYPPEVLLISHFIFMNNSDDIMISVHTVLKDIQTNKLYTFFSSEIKQAYIHELEQFFVKFGENPGLKSKSRSDIIQWILRDIKKKKLYGTWDVYILSAFMLRIIASETEPKRNKYQEELFLLCCSSLHPNPRKRPDLKDVQIHCNQILMLFEDNYTHMQTLKNMPKNERKYEKQPVDFLRDLTHASD